MRCDLLDEGGALPAGPEAERDVVGFARPIERSIISVKSAAICSGSRTRSTSPRRADAISRSSATSQSAPTPRQSHWNAPRHFARTASSSAGDSSCSWPSVSRMAWWIAPGYASKRVWARVSHCPIAVPPPAFRLVTAASRLRSRLGIRRRDQLAVLPGYTSRGVGPGDHSRSARRRGCSRWRPRSPPWRSGSSIAGGSWIRTTSSRMTSAAVSPGARARAGAGRGDASRPRSPRCRRPGGTRSGTSPLRSSSWLPSQFLSVWRRWRDGNGDVVVAARRERVVDERTRDREWRTGCVRPYQLREPPSVVGA